MANSCSPGVLASTWGQKRVLTAGFHRKGLSILESIICEFVGPSQTGWIFCSDLLWNKSIVIKKASCSASAHSDIHGQSPWPSSHPDPKHLYNPISATAHYNKPMACTKLDKLPKEPQQCRPWQRFLFGTRIPLSQKSRRKPISMIYLLQNV